MHEFPSVISPVLGPAVERFVETLEATVKGAEQRFSPEVHIAS